MRMRVGVGRSETESYRPRLCLWVDGTTGMILHFELGEPANDYLPLVLHSLGKLVDRLEGLPSKILLSDPALGASLQKKLSSAGVQVIVRDSLPTLERAARSLEEVQNGGAKPEPGLLDQKGMTPAHVKAFADAAKTFYEARPWQHLTDDDLIAIESPAGPDGAQFTQVLGAGGQTFGLGFVRDVNAHDQLRDTGVVPPGNIGSLTFGDIDAIPFDDGEAFLRHRFPVAGPNAYPTFLRLLESKGRHYPTPDQLVWAEGLLRALAATTEAEMDAGRWSKQVQTFKGPATYSLSMPILLEQRTTFPGGEAGARATPSRRQMEAMLQAISEQAAARGRMTPDELKQFARSLDLKNLVAAPDTKAGRAQAIVDQALDARGRRQVQLAHEALKIDPDCVEALLLLAERAGDPAAALRLYRQAVEAGERIAGPERLAQSVGQFWSVPETRPYMRARQQLAVALLDSNQADEGIGHLKELLRLNPGDNQGNRYLLTDALLTTGRLEELDHLLNRSEHKDEVSAEWAYTRALLAYRKGGDSPEATRRLDEAMRVNAHVLPFLTGRKQLPPFMPPRYSPGSEEEAILYVESAAPAWEETPEAMEWLEATLMTARRPRAEPG